MPVPRFVSGGCTLGDRLIGTDEPVAAGEMERHVHAGVPTDERRADAARSKGDRKRVVDATRWRWMSTQRVSKVATSSSPEGKKFAQFGAIRLVQREIGSLAGKFFLAGVQAVRTGIGSPDVSASSSCPTRAREVAKKKKRVLPMFFFRQMSVACIRCFRSRCGAGVASAFRCRPGMPAKEKKLR